MTKMEIIEKRFGTFKLQYVELKNYIKWQILTSEEYEDDESFRHVILCGTAKDESNRRGDGNEDFPFSDNLKGCPHPPIPPDRKENKAFVKLTFRNILDIFRAMYFVAMWGKVQLRADIDYFGVSPDPW